MIKAENRLKEKRTVNRVLQRGFRMTKPDFSLKVLKTPQQVLKMTVVVGKKVSNSAVTRNKIKRRVREAFAPNLLQVKGYSLAVFPRLSALEAEFTKLQKEAAECLSDLQSS